MAALAGWIVFLIIAVLIVLGARALLRMSRGGRHPDGSRPRGRGVTSLEQALQSLNANVDELAAAAQHATQQAEGGIQNATDLLKKLEEEKDKAQKVSGVLGQIRNLLSGGGAAIFFILLAASQVRAEWWDPGTWFVTPDTTAVAAGDTAAAQQARTEGTVSWSRCFADGTISGLRTNLWIGLAEGDTIRFFSDDKGVYPKWRNLAQVLTFGKRIRWQDGNIESLEIISSNVDPMMAVPYNEDLSLQEPEGSEIKQNLRFYLDNEFGTRKPLHAYVVFPVYYTPVGFPEDRQVSIRIEIGPFNQSWVDAIMTQIYDDQMYHLVIHGPTSAPVEVINAAGLTSSSSSSPSLRIVYEKGNYVMRVPPHRIEFRAVIEREIGGFPAKPAAGKLGPGINELSGYEQMKKRSAAAQKKPKAKPKPAAAAKQSVEGNIAGARKLAADATLDSLMQIMRAEQTKAAAKQAAEEAAEQARLQAEQASLEAEQAALDSMKASIRRDLERFKKLLDADELLDAEATELENLAARLQGVASANRPPGIKWPSRSDFRKAERLIEYSEKHNK